MRLISVPGFMNVLINNKNINNDNNNNTNSNNNNDNNSNDNNNKKIIINIKISYNKLLSSLLLSAIIILINSFLHKKNNL